MTLGDQIGSGAEQSSSGTLARLPAEYLETRWYAAYTNPRHEKQVAVQMDRKSIECFLPVYRSVRRWKDRHKELELPLFPGYVFVHIALRDSLQVLQSPGVVQFVRNNQVLFPQYRRNRTCICGKSRLKNYARFNVLEFRDLFFQFHV